MTHPVDGTPVPTFNPSKTIADLFKYRTPVGLEVALKALQALLESRFRDQGALRHYA